MTRRYATALAAFEADTGGTTNVMVVRRAEPFGEGGTARQAGGTVLASRGLGSQPANGPSTLPSLPTTSRRATGTASRTSISA